MKKFYLLLLLLPFMGNSQNPKQFPIDKQLHFLAGSTISGVTYGLVLNHTKSRKKAFLYSITTPFIIGTAKEIYDARNNKNDFDTKDLGATVLGGLIVSITFELF